MTVEFRVKAGHKLSIANTGTKLLTHVKWFVSPWEAKGDPTDERYWFYGDAGGGHMPALHAGDFALKDKTIEPGDYRVEWLFATPDGESHHEVQHLTVEP